MMEFLGGVAIAGALWYGSREIALGRLTPGEFTSFVAALLLMYGPIKKLSRVNANLQQAVAASERIFELLDTHTEVRERPGAAAAAAVHREIEFQDVSFSYEDGHGRNTLRGVSFTVRAGQMVAIVGRSGAGKTTLVNLLPRFYDVTGGAILIDGRDLRDVTLASLRAQIGMVTQETVLFDDTIAANIAYGTPGAAAGTDRGGGPGGQRARLHRGAAARLPDHDRRARPAPVGRSATASCDCPRAAQEFAAPDSRRSHLRARPRIRTAGPGSPGHADAEPHVVRHCAPAVDRAPRRRDHRARPRARRRGGPPRRVDRATERHLRAAASDCSCSKRKRRPRDQRGSGPAKIRHQKPFDPAQGKQKAETSR